MKVKKGRNWRCKNVRYSNTKWTILMHNYNKNTIRNKCVTIFLCRLSLLSFLIKCSIGLGFMLDPVGIEIGLTGISNWMKKLLLFFLNKSSRPNLYINKVGVFCNVCMWVIVPFLNLKKYFQSVRVSWFCIQRILLKERFIVIQYVKHITKRNSNMISGNYIFRYYWYLFFYSILSIYNKYISGSWGIICVN